MSRFLKIVLFTSFILTAYLAEAQKKVKLVNADSLAGGITNGQSFQKYFGDVQFRQEQTTIFADSAIIYGRNDVVEAFGNVKILHGDSITITSRRATYNGNSKIAQLRQKVVFTKLDAMTLYTDNLDYNVPLDIATYFDGGKLVDSANVLTSIRGTYEDRTNMATFREDVVATFPSYVLESEALRYNTLSEVVYFIAPTTLTHDDGTVINYNEGEYNTKAQTSVLERGQIETEEYRINASRYNINDLLKVYQAFGEVRMVAKNDNIIITGEEALMNDRKKISKVYGNPVMRKPMEGDTLYLSADTLVSIDSEVDSLKRLLAYGDVKIYKKDLQGVADSLVYFPADSLMKFFVDPVLWSSGNQMTADTITMFIKNESIDRMAMDVNSFVVSIDTLENYNQIKGRDMISYFTDGQISRVDVDGNCESLFFALDDNEEYVVGMNKIICSNMKIFFQNNAAKKVSALYRPDASFIPPHELKPDDLTLRGFLWRGDLRPTLEQVIHRNSGSSLPTSENNNLPNN